MLNVFLSHACALEMLSVLLRVASICFGDFHENIPSSLGEDEITAETHLRRKKETRCHVLKYPPSSANLLQFFTDPSTVRTCSPKATMDKL